ncbi:MAG: acyloxyacyl hydrolase [Pseudomonadota bacterium]|uniref:Acyloxyacyl hydrolase n=1 Tax=Candidatus Desulfatibia profunda TaxID=2841695 RepID=A0A8J6TJG3_9BACT|nr:acyloxyacyl hydrolase [Candidatus Desulfatibia profunda]
MMLPRLKQFIFLLTAVAMFFVPPSAFGDSAESDSQAPFKLTESTIIVGYGSGSIAEGSYEPVALIWHFGFDVRRFFPQLENHRGTLSVCLEPKINPVFNPETDLEFGIGAGLKYRYPVTKKVSAYVFGAVGPHFITVKTKDQANGFIFFDDIGAGCSFFLTERSALSLEYRFRHMSNVSIKEPNGGLDVHIGAIGYSLFF